MRETPEKRGSGAFRKNLKNLSSTPLRRNARFGILLTRCAQKGIGPDGARQSIFENGMVLQERDPAGSQMGASGRDAEHNERETLVVMPGAPRGAPTVSSNSFF